MRPWVIVFIVVLVVYVLGTEVLRRYYDAKVQAFYEAGLFDQAFETLNGFLARTLLSTFKQHYYRFLVHEARGEDEMAERMLELMVRMRNSSRRQAQITAVAFNYYAQHGNKQRAKELLHDLKGCKAADRVTISDCQLTYDIVFGNRHDMIDKMEAMLPRADRNLTGKLYYLLAKQYANAGNKQQARAYQARFEELEAQERPTPAS